MRKVITKNIEFDCEFKESDLVFKTRNNLFYPGNISSPPKNKKNNIEKIYQTINFWYYFNETTKVSKFIYKLFKIKKLDIFDLKKSSSEIDLPENILAKISYKNSSDFCANFFSFFMKKRPCNTFIILFCINDNLEIVKKISKEIIEFCCQSYNNNSKYSLIFRKGFTISQLLFNIGMKKQDLSFYKYLTEQKLISEIKPKGLAGIQEILKIDQILKYEIFL